MLLEYPQAIVRPLGPHFQTAGAINLRHVTHIAETFFTVALGLLVVEYASGEVVRFPHELSRVFLRVRFVNGWFTADLRFQMQTFVRKRRLHMQDPFGSVHPEKPVHASAVSRIHTGNDARGKAHRPGYVFFDGIETSVLINNRAITLQFVWFLAR